MPQANDLMASNADGTRMPARTHIEYLCARFLHNAGTRTLRADEWEHACKPRDESWWAEWSKWLKDPSIDQVDTPPMGAPGSMPLCDSPGTYVLER